LRNSPAKKTTAELLVSQQTNNGKMLGLSGGESTAEDASDVNKAVIDVKDSGKKDNSDSIINAR
jgi:hypothetical protein